MDNTPPCVHQQAQPAKFSNKAKRDFIMNLITENITQKTGEANIHWTEDHL